MLNQGGKCKLQQNTDHKAFCIKFITMYKYMITGKNQRVTQRLLCEDIQEPGELAVSGKRNLVALEDKNKVFS